MSILKASTLRDQCDKGKSQSVLLSWMWHLYFKLKPQQREVAQGFRRYPEALIVVVNDKETTQSQAQRVTKSDSDTRAAPCSDPFIRENRKLEGVVNIGELCFYALALPLFSVSRKTNQVIYCKKRDRILKGDTN